ncbi:MAG: peptide deformylase [Algicola sp.]|nr:peptide deformylase [Algicola sp.]
MEASFEKRLEKSFAIAQIGEPVLREKAVAVEDFACIELNRFIDKLLASMISAGGVGIAAPQVSCGQQIMIIASKPNARYPDAPQMDPLVLINPQIKLLHGPIVSDWEGCLSVPGIRGFVSRHENVDIEYQDRDGNSQAARFSGFVARIFQHEHDHLVGLTFVDRVSSNQHLVAESVLPKILSGEINFIAKP